jgi:hypothetical protein
MLRSLRLSPSLLVPVSYYDAVVKVANDLMDTHGDNAVRVVIEKK